ncbi:MAG: Calx-beta domain-containing protein [Pyrinomonadaceae bacterium]
MTRIAKYLVLALACVLGASWLILRAGFSASASPPQPQLSAAFDYKILTPEQEAPLELRLFETAVKTDSQGKIITGLNNDPVKNIMGAESAGVRAGMERFTKIMFGAGYIDGRPDPGTRIDPNNPVVKSGNQLWPNRKQPFRSEPRSLALTPDGSKLYVTLPGREGYPDWRVAVVNTASRQVLRWVDLRPPGQSKGLRPIGIKVSPLNANIYPKPYAVVLNQYGNFASVLDTSTDSIIGTFETGFYGEKLIFNSNGTRLYLTDRFRDEVRAFRVDAGPTFTQIAEIPTGTTELERANPRDLDISADGKTLYVANTLGHTVSAINIENDTNTLVKVLPVGGLSTDVKIAGRWGIVSGQETNTKLNGRESGHGLPTKDANGVAIKNNGQPLGYTPVMSDGTKATTFDDIGSELNIFDTTTNLFVYRYVDEGRDLSQLVTPGQYVDLQDHAAAQKIIKGSGPEQMTIKGNLLFVTYAHSEQVQAFRINANAADPSQILTPLGIEMTGGVTPQGIEASPDGRTIYVANFQTEDVSFLNVDQNGNLQRQGFTAVGVTPTTPDPTTGGHGQNLFATDEEVGLRWFFSSAYSDDGQKSCGFCHWDGRQDGCQWNVAANAVGGVKTCPQNKDISDNWPEWYEGLNNDFMAYASACNGEVLLGERTPTPIFPQADPVDRFHAREDFVENKTEENSRAIGRNDLNSKAFKVGYYDMAYLQILWSQNENRRLPNPLDQFPEQADAAKIARGKQIFSSSVAQGGGGCAECHHNGNKLTNGVLDDTFQDYNIHEPGVISEDTVDGNGPFYRPTNDYFFVRFAPPQDVGTPQNFSSRNTKHLRAFWDSVPRWLHHGDAHTVREILLAPDSPLLQPGERGFNFRTVRMDQKRGPNNLPTEVPITFGDSQGGFAGDGKGPIYVSLDSPFVIENGKPQIDRLGTSNLAPLVVGGQINPALAASNVQVIKETHGKTSHLSASDFEALTMYLRSLASAKKSSSSNDDPKPSPSPTPSASPTPSPSPTPTASPTPSVSPTPSPSPSPTASPTPSPSPSPSPDAEHCSIHFSAPGYSVNEGNGSVTVTVLRECDRVRDSQVKFTTVDGTANARGDFTFTSGKLFFAPGETSKTFTVLITDDAIVEGDETITLRLFDAGGSASLSNPGVATLTIKDNDTGQAIVNPSDQPDFFVREHYLDFLNREADEGGLGYWTNGIRQCGTDDSCIRARRIDVSAAFFIELEFQETGNFVYRMYKASLGRQPTFAEFMPDRSRIVGGDQLEASKQLFADEWVQREAFRASYPDSMTPEAFVNKLFDTASLVPYTQERLQLASDMRNGKSRAQVLRDVIEMQDFKFREYNPSFVLMQYYGYLRRDPDEGGYNFWLNVLNNREPNNYRGMVCSFITSAEYEDRFSSVRTHSNAECGQ